MKKISSFRILWIVLLFAAGSFLYGCGAKKPNPAFEKAQSLYQQAESDPDVMSKAPVEMHEARKMLNKAEEADEEEDVERLSYLAQRQVELAMAEAEAKKAQERMESLSNENRQVLLQARQSEVEEARQEALRLKQEAEARAREVALAQERAEQLKQEAEMARQHAEQARAEARRLEKELTDLQAKRTDRGLVLTLGDVLFDTGSAELKAGSLRSLDNLVAFLQENPNRNVLVEGHTDSVGNEAYNQRLSQQRAESVKMALIHRGVSPGRIIATGYGESYPVASNSTEAGKQRNRRVEVIILDEGVRGETMMR